MALDTYVATEIFTGLRIPFTAEEEYPAEIGTYRTVYNYDEPGVPDAVDGGMLSLRAARQSEASGQGTMRLLPGSVVISASSATVGPQFGSTLSLNTNAVELGLSDYSVSGRYAGISMARGIGLGSRVNLRAGFPFGSAPHRRIDEVWAHLDTNGVEIRSHRNTIDNTRTNNSPPILIESKELWSYTTPSVAGLYLNGGLGVMDFYQGGDQAVVEYRFGRANAQLYVASGAHVDIRIGTSQWIACTDTAIDTWITGSSTQTVGGQSCDITYSYRVSLDRTVDLRIFFNWAGTAPSSFSWTTSAFLPAAIRPDLPGSAPYNQPARGTFFPYLNFSTPAPAYYANVEASGAVTARAITSNPSSFKSAYLNATYTIAKPTA